MQKVEYNICVRFRDSGRHFPFLTLTDSFEFAGEKTDDEIAELVLGHLELCLEKEHIDVHDPNFIEAYVSSIRVIRYIDKRVKID